MNDLFQIENLRVRAGSAELLKGVTLSIKRNEILSFIGPAGSGKTTLLRVLNRLTDLEGGLKVEGKVLFDGKDIFDRETDPSVLRRRASMVFATPTPSPSPSGTT